MTIQIQCPAKINLTLDVLNRREDGYHNLSMVMQEIAIFDTLTLTQCSEGISLTADKEGVPTDESNLIIKAAKAFYEKSGIKDGIQIRLNKRIPMGAGLGGGSTDCAGTLMGLNQLYDQPLSMDVLSAMAKKLGADVPFFLFGGCMLAEGIGEKLTPLPPLTGVSILVAKPPVHVSTAYVYQNLVLDQNTPHPNTKGVIAALESGDAEMLGKHAGNVLETVTAAKYPQIQEYKNIMKNHSAIYSLMSGSGSSVFGIFETKAAAQSAAKEFESLTPEVFCTTAV